MPRRELTTRCHPVNEPIRAAAKRARKSLVRYSGPKKTLDNLLGRYTTPLEMHAFAEQVNGPLTLQREGTVVPGSKSPPARRVGQASVGMKLAC